MEVDNEGYRCNNMCSVERAIVQTLIGRIAGDLQDCQDWPLLTSHDVLSTKERIARKQSRASPACQMPGCDRASENHVHTLVLCRSNNEMELEAALRLKLGVEEDLELPLV